MNGDLTSRELLAQVEAELDRRMDLVFDCLEQEGWFREDPPQELPPTAMAAVQHVRELADELARALTWAASCDDLDDLPQDQS